MDTLMGFVFDNNATLTLLPVTTGNYSWRAVLAYGVNGTKQAVSTDPHDALMMLDRAVERDLANGI